MADDNQNGEVVVELNLAAAKRRRHDTAPPEATPAVPLNCASAREHLLAEVRKAKPKGPFSGRGG